MIMLSIREASDILKKEYKLNVSVESFRHVAKTAGEISAGAPRPVKVSEKFVHDYGKYMTSGLLVRDIYHKQGISPSRMKYITLKYNISLRDCFGYTSFKSMEDVENVIRYIKKKS